MGCQRCHICPANEIRKRKQKKRKLLMQDIRAASAQVTPLPDCLEAAPAVDDCPSPAVSQRSLKLVAHDNGLCKPCAWFWKPEGCKNGLECEFCHVCRAG